MLDGEDSRGMQKHIKKAGDRLLCPSDRRFRLESDGPEGFGSLDWNGVTFVIAVDRYRIAAAPAPS